MNCSRCGSSNIRLQGHRRGRQRYFCQNCKRWGTVGSRNPNTQEFSSTYSEHGENAEYVVTTEKRIRTEKDIIELIKLDTTQWEIAGFKVGTYEGYRKDRRVKWLVDNGRVLEGDVDDSGKMLVVTMHRVEVSVRRKTQEIRTNLVVEDIKRDISRFAPKYPKIQYPKIQSGLLCEICIPDVHLGKLVWGEECGENCDLKSQTLRVVESITELLGYVKDYPIERILLPLGNDYYNSDTELNTTTKGTIVDEDTRWQKTFRAGRVLAVQLIDMCATLAPVDVLIVPGNHDETRSFFLGDTLSAWYRNCPNVQVNNSAKRRKYYLWGQSLIGLTHGDQEKMDRLAGLMSVEEPDLWAKSRFREWHIGHLHHLKETILEVNGVVVRTLRSLSPADAWHYQKGFVGALQTAESFLWSRDKGLVATFSTIARRNED